MTCRAFSLCGLLALAGTICSCSPQPAPPPVGGTNALTALTTLVAPLPPGEATNRSLALERHRHGPRQARFVARTFQAPGASLRYLHFEPRPGGGPRPLVLSLHGGGPRRQFEHLLEPYAPGFAYGLGRLTAPESQAAHPCHVIAPWSNHRGWDADNLRLVLALLESLTREFSIDTNRVYVTGQSMGGFGTFAILAAAPGRFAGAIPICGGGDPATAPALHAVPLWIFHGTADTVVDVRNSRDMVAALQRAGGRPRYWEYTGATHAETAERAYGEPELLDWLFAQRRGEPAAP